MSSMMIRPITQKIALNVNFTTPKQMSNNVFISLQFCMLHLIDGLAYINRFQKKTSDIDSRIVWPSFDITKLLIILIHATFRMGFCLCRSNECSLWLREARVSERKRRNCAFVYGGHVRSHERNEWEALAEIAIGSTFADCQGKPQRLNCLLKGQRPRPLSRRVELKLGLNHMVKTIV